MKRKIAVALAALTLLALAIFIATALDRIKHLENVVARLEKDAASPAPKHPQAISHAEFSPDGKIIATHDGKSVLIWNSQTGEPLTPQPIPNPPAQKLPPGWKPHEFNGMTYYLVPLAHTEQDNAKLQLAK